MQITVTIPDDFAAQVQARGLTLERYVEKLDCGANPHTSPRSGYVTKLADLESFFEEMSAHSDKIPILPDEAFTRESFYRDHD